MQSSMKLTLTDRQTDVIHTLTQSKKPHAGCVCNETTKRSKTYSIIMHSLYQADMNGQMDKRTHRLTCHPPHPGTAGPLWSCWRPNDGRCSTSLTAVVSGLRAQQRSNLRKSFSPSYCVKSFSPSCIYIPSPTSPMSHFSSFFLQHTPPPPLFFFFFEAGRGTRKLIQ